MMRENALETQKISPTQLSSFTVRKMVQEDIERAKNIYQKAFSTIYKNAPLFSIGDLSGNEPTSTKRYCYLAEKVGKKGEKKAVGFIIATHKPAINITEEHENLWDFGGKRSKQSYSALIKELQESKKSIEACVHVNFLAVDPSHQDNRVGLALFKQVEESAAKDFPGEVIEVFANPGSKRAFQFYRQNGLQEVIRNPHAFSRNSPLNENSRSSALLQKRLPFYSAGVPMPSKGIHAAKVLPIATLSNNEFLVRRFDCDLQTPGEDHGYEFELKKTGRS